MHMHGGRFEHVQGLSAAEILLNFAFAGESFATADLSYIYTCYDFAFAGVHVISKVAEP